MRAGLGCLERGKEARKGQMRSEFELMDRRPSASAFDDAEEWADGQPQGVSLIG
jgi:hypothetical protein